MRSYGDLRWDLTPFLEGSVACIRKVIPVKLDTIGDSGAAQKSTPGGGLQQRVEECKEVWITSATIITATSTTIRQQML